MYIISWCCLECPSECGLTTWLALDKSPQKFETLLKPLDLKILVTSPQAKSNQLTLTLLISSKSTPDPLCLNQSQIIQSSWRRKTWRNYIKLHQSLVGIKCCMKTKCMQMETRHWAIWKFNGEITLAKIIALPDIHIVNKICVKFLKWHKTYWNPFCVSCVHIFIAWIKDK